MSSRRSNLFSFTLWSKTLQLLVQIFCHQQPCQQKEGRTTRTTNTTMISFTPTTCLLLLQWTWFLSLFMNNGLFASNPFFLLRKKPEMLVDEWWVRKDCSFPLEEKAQKPKVHHAPFLCVLEEFCSTWKHWHWISLLFVQGSRHMWLLWWSTPQHNNNNPQQNPHISKHTL